MKIFHHNDPDGICSAHLIDYYHPYGPFEAADFFPITYGDRFPIERIQPNEEVWIVDYSLEPEDLYTLRQHVTENIVWIDHHITAIDRFIAFPFTLDGLRRFDLAGCMLTWIYLRSLYLPSKKITETFIQLKIDSAPYYVKLLADWDTWTFQYGEETRAFQAWFRAYDLDPLSLMWAVVANDPKPAIESGKEMLQFQRGFYDRYVRAHGFDVQFEGHLCHACNIKAGSDAFEQADEYAIVIPFIWDGTKWTVSLYSDEVDVSEIAKRYGGGGHAGAAGFQYHGKNINDLFTHVFNNE